MIKLQLAFPTRRVRLLCLGAHSDDLEIGCGGTVLHWLSAYRHVEVTWVVLSAVLERAQEAKRSARSLLGKASHKSVLSYKFRDGHFPIEYEELKRLFEQLKKSFDPDLILTHRLEDRHQDHRLVGELTWQTWRNHLILEYEVPKFEGDLGQPNFFVQIEKAIAERKVRHLLKHFGSQRSKDWFNAETFRGLMRLRGVECRSSSGLAEAYYVRKAVL